MSCAPPSSRAQLQVRLQERQHLVYRRTTWARDREMWLSSGLRRTPSKSSADKDEGRRRRAFLPRGADTDRRRRNAHASIHRSPPFMQEQRWEAAASAGYPWSGTPIQWAWATDLAMLAWESGLRAHVRRVPFAFPRRLSDDKKVSFPRPSKRHPHSTPAY